MDAASIEQMNKVRVSLGMAPLPVPGADKNSGPTFKPSKGDSSESESEDDLSTLDKRQAAAGNNWAKLEAERKEKAERKDRKEAAKKARDLAQRNAKLEGKGLGDEDESGELDTRAWLLGQKKRQKKIDKARKLEEQLAEQEREQQAQYTSKDLKGVRVGHEVDEFDDTTGEHILTLKDAEIGDESEDDELENAELRAKEKQQERLELKKRRPDYDPTDQEEKQGVLSKYDEEIDGKKQKQFTLDGLGSSEQAQRKAVNASSEVKDKRVKINLDMLKEDGLVSDYVDPSTIKVKKPKKSKKERKTRKKDADDDDIFPIGQPSTEPRQDEEAMDVDIVQPNGSTAASKKRNFEFDDDDLQAKLAEQRRATLKKRKKLDGAELARQMRAEMPVDDVDVEEEGGLILDETREFVDNLKKPEAPELRERKSKAPESSAREENSEDDEGDTVMASYADADAEESLHAANKRETSETPAPAESHTATGLDDEDNMTGQGLGSALGLLRKRGLIADSAAEKQVAQDRARAQFLASKQNLIDEYDARARDQREAERKSGHWARMSNRERDEHSRRENENREKFLSKLLAEQFNREYRPDVKLRYNDEYGREMNQKEAFKHLSHMFHGKGSGKQKTEKRLKKIEDERKDMAKGVLNIGDEGGMMGVGGREGKRRGQAGVRLQ